MEDPIVEEVRRVREERAARFGFELKRIMADAKRCERASKRKVVSFPGRASFSMKGAKTKEPGLTFEPGE